MKITKDNINNIFKVVDVSNWNTVERPVKLYDSNTRIAIGTGLDYNNIRKDLMGKSNNLDIDMKISFIDDNVVILASNDKFGSFYSYKLDLTIDDINNEYEKYSNDYSYIELVGDNKLYINATRMPSIAKIDLYNSIFSIPLHDIKTTRTDYLKFTDAAGERSLKSIITAILPDNLSEYKNAEYTSLSWIASGDDSYESILITDEKHDRTILLRL